MGRNEMTISPRSLNQLMTYPWPGNIRELENIIERSLILQEGNTLDSIALPGRSLPIPNLQQPEEKIRTMKEMEKEHILSVLRKCNGKLAGPGGAAGILDISPNTLIAKMKKFGISKEYH